MAQDIGITPPPPMDVMGQMQNDPANDPASMLAGMLGAQGPPPADIFMEVSQLDPLLTELSRQVPSMAPEVAGLLGRLHARMGPPMMGPGMPGIGMGGPPLGGNGLPPPMPGAMTGPSLPPDPMAPPMGGPPPMMGGAPPMGGPPPMGGGLGGPPPMTPGPIGGGMPPAPSLPIGLPGQTPARPNEGAGAMSVAMQIEMILPQIGAKDPTLAPDIQYFVAKMRDEVSRATEVNPAPMAPTDRMMSSLPVSA